MSLYPQTHTFPREKSSIIKVAIIFNFYLSSKMRDERYYQRLNQIREKYGYINDINPEQEIRKIAEKRDHFPGPLHQPPILNHYLDGYQLPAKQQQNQTTTNVFLEARRAKENNSTPPQAYQREVANERTYRHPQVNQTRFPLEKRDVPNVREYPSSYLTTPNAVSKEYSSPIKRLQIELSNPNTPNRQNTHSTQRAKPTQVATTRNSYRTQAANLTDRTHVQYDAVIEDSTRNHIPNTYQAPPPERSLNSTPRNSREPNNVVQNLYNNQEGEDINNKYNASLNNIDKLQERIQAMLNKPKK
jgi:hypothetical protein